MRGVYTADFTASGIATGPRTLLMVRAPSNGVLEILKANITNLSNSTSEQIQGGLFRVTAIGSPVFSGAANIMKHENLDATSTVSASGCILSGESTYDSNPIDKQGFNNLAGYSYDPIPEERPIVPPGGYVGLRITNNSMTSSILTAEVVYREIG